MCENSGSGSDVAGSERLEHLSEKTHFRALQHWISHQCNELKEAFHSLAAGIAAKLSMCVIYLCL